MAYALPGYRTVTNLILGLAACGSVLGLQIQQLDRLDQTPNYELAAQTEATQLTALRTSPTLGFEALVADWTFLSYLQYFGDDEARAVAGYDLAADYLDRVIELDPRFLFAYLFVSPGVSYYQGQPERAITLFDRGLAALSPQIHPNAFIVPKFKALDLFLLRGDVPGAIAAYQKTADWVEGTPFADYRPGLEQTIAYLQANPDSLQAQYIGWSDVYTNAVDAVVRDRAATELRSLGAREVTLEDGSIGFAPPPGL
ncbi:MAG: hypothetical protein EAZ61_14980 [Oscillatoriales cyanobacterium]|nr:MAG: hypothetical protein EAZ61_14980 [Oscillatoriales cyanobacterium]